MYIRFLNLIHAFDDRTDAPAIDADAKKLLEVIAVRHSQEKQMTVGDAMALERIASSSTILRRLDQLRELGMIDTIFKDKNRRTKYIVPTQMAHDYFKQVSVLMAQAVSQD